MKKLVFIFMGLLLTFTSQAQLAKWGPVLKLEEYVINGNQNIHGKYLGEINGTDYYTYYSRKPKLVTLEDTRFAFLAVKGTTITKFTPYSDNKYEFLDICIANDQICVTYETGEKKAKRVIKVDYYSPATLKKIKTVNLYDFDPIDKVDPYINIFHSENKEFIGLMANGKNPNTGNGTIIVKTYNNKMEELWTSYYDYNGNGYPEIGDMIITNSGNVILNFMKYQDKDKERLQSFYFVQVSDERIAELEYQLKEKFNMVDYKIGEYKNNQNLFVYTNDIEVNGLKLDFSNEQISNIFTYQTYEGNWKIEKIIDLGNGKYTAALQNRDMATYVVRNSNGAMTTTFFYWNRSFLFLGINGENDELIYKKNLGRKYNHIQGIPSYEQEITMDPYFFVKDGDIHVVYNTDKNTEDKVSNKKEKPTIIPGLVMGTMKPVTKMAIISEDGGVQVKTLFSSKTDKGIFLARLSHLNSDQDLIIVKAKYKKTAVGKVNL